MGTPEFAVPSLDALRQQGYDVAAVVTATDKMGGRGGKQVLQSAVKKYAIQNNLLILQPEKLRATEFVEILRGLEADLFVVVAFRMLPDIVWTMPPLGTINLHGSLLPKYRGAAPINWAVINGEVETGVTTFFLKHDIDTGDMIYQSRFPISDDDTAGVVHDRMMLVGAETLLKTVQDIENQRIVPQPQAETLVTHAPKIFPEMCQIDFSKTTAEVHNFVRGLSPLPTAWTVLDGLKFKIFQTQKEISNQTDEMVQLTPNIEQQMTPQYEPPKFVSDGKNFLKVATSDGFVHLLDVQLEGRRRLPIREFLNGYRFNM